MHVINNLTNWKSGSLLKNITEIVKKYAISRLNPIILKVTNKACTSSHPEES